MLSTKSTVFVLSAMKYWVEESMSEIMARWAPVRHVTSWQKEVSAVSGEEALEDEMSERTFDDGTSSAMRADAMVGRAMGPAASLDVEGW